MPFGILSNKNTCEINWIIKVEMSMEIISLDHLIVVLLGVLL
jgi:hypothetical protein